MSDTLYNLQIYYIEKIDILIGTNDWHVKHTETILKFAIFVELYRTYDNLWLPAPRTNYNFAAYYDLDSYGGWPSP